MKVILNWGMGVDSSVIAHKWATDPSSRDFELADLIVISAQTGNEFRDTKLVGESHMLPIFRAKGIRYVQLARNGPREADGITVLDDSRTPSVMHIEGVYRLSDEMTAAGTIPPVASRRCSLKAKGVVIDAWLDQELRGEPFRQAMGFNADELKRVTRDSCYGGDNRNAEYPLMTWGMGRHACEDYLREAFGIAWPKSCCTFCPFANGKPEIMARYRAMPDLAAEALLLEHVSMALNPAMHLYAQKSLLSCIEADDNHEALRLFQAKLDASEWALYRVRRVYAKKGNASRKVEILDSGERQLMIANLFTSEGTPEWLANSWRTYLVRRKANAYPAAEEMLVVAPSLASEKERGNFEKKWAAVKKMSLAVIA